MLVRKVVILPKRVWSFICSLPRFNLKNLIDFGDTHRIYYVYTNIWSSIMVKNLIKHGNSYALVIDKPIMELLQVTPDTELELTTNGDKLVISPVRPKGKQAKLEKIIDEVNRDFSPSLRKLAE